MMAQTASETASKSFRVMEHWRERGGKLNRVLLGRERRSEGYQKGAQLEHLHPRQPVMHEAWCCPLAVRDCAGPWMRCIRSAVVIAHARVIGDIVGERAWSLAVCASGSWGSRACR